MTHVLKWLSAGTLAIAQGNDPDFFLLLNKCRITVAYLTPQEDQFRQIEGTGFLLACFRNSRLVTCTMTHSDQTGGANGKQVKYQVDVDSPPLMTFADSTVGDYFSVNTLLHSVASITRVVESTYAGAKVCSGTFATGMEMNALRNKKP